MPLLEAVEHAALRAGVPVDARIEKGRTLTHALKRLWEVERFDRIVAPAPVPGAPGFSEKQLAWLLTNAPDRDGGVEARCVNYGWPHEEARRAPRRCARKCGRRRLRDGCDRGRQALGPGAQPRRPLHLRGAARLRLSGGSRSPPPCRSRACSRSTGSSCRRPTRSSCATARTGRCSPCIS